MFNKEVMNAIRTKFPRAERDALGRKRAFLDNGTGTLVVGKAAEAEARARLDYSANVYGIFDESTITTIGVDFCLKEISLEEGNCSLQLWDLGGQERFRHLLSNFVMGARGSLLLMDLTIMPKMSHVLNWVNIVRLHDIDLPIILVGTKLDLDESRICEQREALDLMELHKLQNYFECSSKTGKNVEAIFRVLLRNILRQKGYNHLKLK